MWRTGVGLAIALSALIPVTASALDDEAAASGLNRIRAADPNVEALIAEGVERSMTFRELIVRFARTPWLVFVQRGRCPDAARYQGLRPAPIGPPACLIHRVATYDGAPYLLVRIDNRYSRTPNQDLALIAHELQHALEVAESPDVIDTETLTAFFRRHAEVSFRAPGLIGYETAAAVRAGRQVLGELRRQAPHLDAPRHAANASDRPQPIH